MKSAGNCLPSVCDIDRIGLIRSLWQDVGEFRFQTATVGSAAYCGDLTNGHVLGPQRECPDIWETWIGENSYAMCVGRAINSSGTERIIYDLQPISTTIVASETGLKIAEVHQTTLSYEAFVIDDLGYVQQSREEMEVLFTLLAERYERGSVMLTSNLPFSKWGQIFKDAMTTAAAIDRLVHHSVIVELNVASCRAETAKQNQLPHR